MDERVRSLREGGLAAALLEASDWLNEALLDELALRGWPRLTRTQSQVFLHLGAGRRPAELARRVGITRQSMQTLLQGLEEEGLVAQERQAARAVLVRLAPRGEALVADARTALRGLERELERRIGASHVRALRSALAADWGARPSSGGGQTSTVSRAGPGS
jgi:DNA-binding MarR family transcriptional regulator